jgi:hypothetical protein
MKRFLYAALLALFVLPATAQTLSPPVNTPKFRAFDANGKPLIGGKLWSYQAGTTTPKATYTDATGITPNTNPVILDSTGQANVFLGTGTYKFMLENSLGVEQWTEDQIAGATSPGITSFNGRTGAVVPVSGDYDCAMITNCSPALTFSAAFSVAGTAVDLASVGTAGTYAIPSSVTTNIYGQITAITAGTAGPTAPTCNSNGCYSLRSDGWYDEWGVSGVVPQGADTAMVTVTFPQALTTTTNLSFQAWPDNCAASTCPTKVPVSISGDGGLTTTSVNVYVSGVTPTGGGGDVLNNAIHVHWRAIGH